MKTHKSPLGDLELIILSSVLKQISRTEAGSLRLILEPTIVSGYIYHACNVTLVPVAQVSPDPFSTSNYSLPKHCFMFQSPYPQFCPPAPAWKFLPAPVFAPQVSYRFIHFGVHREPRPSSALPAHTLHVNSTRILLCILSRTPFAP